MKIDTDKFWKLQLVIRPACSQELLELLGTQAPPPETEQKKRKKQRARKKVNSHLIFMKQLEIENKTNNARGCLHTCLSAGHFIDGNERLKI